MLAAIGVQVANCAHLCSILLYRGFSEFCQSFTDCWTLVAVSISVQISSGTLSIVTFLHQECVRWLHGTAALF